MNKAAIGAIASLCLQLQSDTTLFVGWFCPRRIASIVYGLLISDKSLPSGELMFTTMAVTVSISVLAYDMTFPSAIWDANRILDKENIHDQMPEMSSVKELPVRLPWKQQR